jgi:hypothetical protein
VGAEQRLTSARLTVSQECAAKRECGHTRVVVARQRGVHTSRARVWSCARESVGSFGTLARV